MDSWPLVAIILVNYNGYKDTVECVQSIIQSDYPNYQIIIVDNASNDASKLQEDKFINAQAKIIYSAKNGGFASGNNIGIHEAEYLNAKYVFALNNDTVIDKDCITSLVNELEKETDAVIATGTIKRYDDNNKYWYCGGTYNRLTGRTHQNAFIGQLNEKSLRVTFASGCALMIRESFLKENGYFDESFFMYSEDTEMCCRVINKGKEIRWVPKAVIYHKAGKSIVAESKRQQYLIIKNSLVMIDRYGSCPCLGRMVWRVYCLYRELLGQYDYDTVKSAFGDSRKQ